MVNLQSGGQSQPDQIWPEILYLDPFGNTTSVLILTMMVLSLIAVAAIVTSHFEPSKRRIGIVFPVVAAAGAVVATYLLYIEKSGVMAASGPFGDCNAVLHSPYAVLFDALPVSALSLVGYLSIFAIWLVSRLSVGGKSDLATLCLFGIVSAGTIVAIYLVGVQLFFVGVTCAWCLASAVFVTTLMWLVAPTVSVARANVTALLPMAFDNNVAETIRRQLRSKILPSYNEIEVAVRRRRVTLGGRVYAACHSDSAEHIASTVEGVRAVDNSIEIIQSEDSKLEWCGRITQQPFTLHQTARELRPVSSRVRRESLSDQDPGGSQ